MGESVFQVRVKDKAGDPCRILVLATDAVEAIGKAVELRRESYRKLSGKDKDQEKGYACAIETCCAEEARRLGDFDGRVDGMPAGTPEYVYTIDMYQGNPEPRHMGNYVIVAHNITAAAEKALELRKAQCDEGINKGENVDYWEKARDTTHIGRVRREGGLDIPEGGGITCE